MELRDLFQKESSFFKQDLKTKDEVINFLSEKLKSAKIIKSEDAFKKAILNREKQDSTGIGDGIAIPHALNPTVLNPTIAFVSLKKPIEWGSLDNKPVDLIFMIATSGKDGNEHLTALADLSGYLMKADVQKACHNVKTFEEFDKLFGTKKEVVKKELKQGQHYDVIGITACPTGIAHTYMAAEKLEEYAKELKMSSKIETQGRRGTENKLTDDDIKNAKVIILAHDKAVTGLDRFNGIEVIDTSTKDAIYNGKTLISGFDKNDKKVTIKAKKGADDEVGELSIKKFKDFKGNLLAGVSRMLPFVVAGGILLGIAFLIDFIAGNGDAGGDFGQVNYFAGWFAAVGKTSMFIMVPVLGGYIAYAIVGPQGLMPGFLAGLFATGAGGFTYGDDVPWSNMWGRIFGNSNLQFESGFIGAMVGGYLAALIVYGLTIWMQNFKKSFTGVRDIVFIPVLSLLGISIAMFVLNIPLGYAMWGIQLGLTKMAEAGLIVLVTAILGLMMCVDMGGPINKIAYVIGTLTVGGELQIIVNGENQGIILMAAAMTAGMVPPLGIALCTVLFRKTWTAKERDAAKANWLMGAFFITEGAIPFMVTDPKRVSVSGLSGGLVAGLIVGLAKVGVQAPHGGIFVIPLAKSFYDVSTGAQIALGVIFFLVAVIAGTVTMALILGFWKQIDIKKGKLKVDSGIVEHHNKKKNNNLMKLKKQQ